MSREDQEVIRDLIYENKQKVVNLTTSISNTNDQITSLQSKVDAIKDGMMSVVAGSLLYYLDNTKYSQPLYFVYTGSNFNQALSSSGNLTDYKVYKDTFDNLDPTLPNWNYIDSKTFEVSGDQTSKFPSGEKIIFAIHDGTSCTDIQLCDINTVTFDGTSTTRVDIVQSILVESDYGLIATYYCGYISGDTIIDNYIVQWEFSHDYLLRTVGTTGTYGLVDMISKLQSSVSMMTIDLTKYSESIIIFADFAAK